VAEESVEKVDEPAEDAAEPVEPPAELEWWEKWWEQQIGLPLLDGLYTDPATGR